MVYKLLVCTVGGTPQAVVASLLHHRPRQVVFLVSEESKASVSAAILPEVVGPLGLDGCNTEMPQLADEQDFCLCVAEIREMATPPIERWLAKGEDFDVVVDITGGTKCMSAALALVARRWRCTFSYVGGKERTKNGVGIVVGGQERIVNTANPWNVLGLEAVEQAALLFDHGDMRAAHRVLDPLKRNTDRGLARQIATLQQLFLAYEQWDSFQHQDALSTLELLEKNGADLWHLFPSRKQHLLDRLKSHQEWLHSVLVHDRSFLLRDLLANADRAAERGRYDDAVARLYRACEMLAQHRMAELGWLDSRMRIALDQLPPASQRSWQARAQKGRLPLGVQDSYSLLQENGDDLARRFRELGLADQDRSPLVARNESILAHGSTPVGTATWTQLRKVLSQLAAVGDEQLPAPFPQLIPAMPT